ncbi:hypothetical protein AB1Y20_005310 [Prymnesium parvum]|uniref:EF-hand domain-containing protein n=1 Tax=Prymnesium parvum TaxID=97485 RepID=A0AB34J5H9_PRYPA
MAEELRRLQLEYEQLLSAPQEARAPVSAERDWTKAAARLQNSLRTDARAEAWRAQALAATAKRRVASAHTPWVGTAWRLAAVQDENVSRVAAEATRRSAKGLGARAQAAVRRAEANEREEVINRVREKELLKRVVMREKREAVWAAAEEQRERQERRRVRAILSSAAREEAWRAELQQREAKEQRRQVEQAWKVASKAAEEAAKEERRARHVAEEIVRVFDADGDRRLDGACCARPCYSRA